MAICELYTPPSSNFSEQIWVQKCLLNKPYWRGLYGLNQIALCTKEAIAADAEYDRLRKQNGKWLYLRREEKRRVISWLNVFLWPPEMVSSGAYRWPDRSKIQNEVTGWKKSLWYFVWRLEGAWANITGTFIFSMSGVLKREKRTMKYTLFVHFWRNRTHIRWKNEKSQNLNKEKSKNPLIFQGKMSTIHLALREKEC